MFLALLLTALIAVFATANTKLANSLTNCNTHSSKWTYGKDGKKYSIRTRIEEIPLATILTPLTYHIFKHPYITTAIILIIPLLLLISPHSNVITLASLPVMGSVNKLWKALFDTDRIEYDADADFISVSTDRRELIIENASKKRKQVYVISEDGSSRTIPTLGQKTRIASVIECVLNHEDGKACRIARSIMDYQMEGHSLSIFVENNGKVKFLKDVQMYRRGGYLSVTQDKLALILKDTDNLEETLETIDNMEDLSGEDQEGIEHSKISEGTYYETIVEGVNRIMQAKFGTAFRYLGGNPDTALMIWSKTKRPVTNAGAQKLAKIKLSGGTKCANTTIRFRLVEFSETFDGVFAILSNTIATEFNLSNAINGKIYQTRAYSDGTYAIKGTMTTPVTKKLEFQLDGRSAVMDVNEYNKTFGKSAKVGEYIEISDFVILSTDSDCGVRETRLSWQFINRAPKLIHEELVAIVKTHLNNLKATAKSNPKSFLPDFGMFKLMKDITPILSYNEKGEVTSDYQGSAAKELEDQIKDTLSKGPKVSGSYLYNLPEDGLEFDQCLISKHTARKLGLKIGDRVNFAVYPALLPKNEYQSNFIFSKEVVGFISANAVCLSYEANQAALRDWDGDKLVIISIEVSVPEQSTDKYSAKLTYDAKGNRIENDYTKLLYSNYSEMGAMECFTHYGSSVGRIDVRVETLAKVLDLDEEETMFLNICEQADIESKKHPVDTRYGFLPIKEFIKENAPELLDAKGIFEKHPDITLRKSTNWRTVDVKHCTAEVKELVKLAKTIKLGNIETQSPKEYRRKAKAIFLDIEENITQDTLELKKQIAKYIYELKGDIDSKKAVVSHLSRQIRRQIGDGAFYNLSVALTIDDAAFGKIFWPLLFTDQNSRIDIDTKTSHCTSGKMTVETVAVDTRINGAFSYEKVNETTTIRIWRSKDMPLVSDKSGKMLPVILPNTIEIIKGQASLDGDTTNLININIAKSVPIIDGDKYTVTGVKFVESAKIKGQIILTGLDLVIS